MTLNLVGDPAFEQQIHSTAEQPPSRCGSETGYKRHNYRREPACRRCLDAHAAHNRAYRKGARPLPRTPKPCGTEAAYHRHLRSRPRTKPCRPCLDAHAAYVAGRETDAAA